MPKLVDTIYLGKKSVSADVKSESLMINGSAYTTDYIVHLDDGHLFAIT